VDKKIAIVYLFSILLIGNAAAQSLPVGTPVLEDAYRNAQLLGQVDSSASFTARPFFPIHAGKTGYHLNESGYITEGPVEKDAGVASKKRLITLLPILWKQQFNSDHPEGINDGSMIPSRGYQTLVSGGFYAKYGFLSLQFYPELVYAENRDFQGFPDKQPDNVWRNYNSFFLNTIDIPEKFGNNPYKKALWGQSSIRLTFGAVSFGLSNENLWWGPGVQNALLMTNSAAGFKHLTLNTVRPLLTSIGSLEGQIIAGRLDQSGFPNLDPQRLLLHKTTYNPKPNDWRYLNGIVISYQPKWVPGLFMGATRSYIIYSKDLGTGIKDYLPIITPITKKADGGNSEDAIPRDQLASVFMRWVAKESHQEIYFEYGREDHSYDLRDFLLEPSHINAYILGFSKLIVIKKHLHEYIQVNVELTQLEQALSTYLRSNFSSPGSFGWYHHGLVYDGYTQQGQYLGAGIGSGSNMQSINLSWVKGFKRIGIQIKRVVQNNDFYNNTIKDYRSHWVDLGGSLFGIWNYKKFLISAKVEPVSSINYQWLYDPIPSVPPAWWDKGKNRLNIHGELAMMYQF